MVHSVDTRGLALSQQLNNAAHQLSGCRVMGSFAVTLQALTTAAQEGVTLGPEHAEVLGRMLETYRDGYPSSFAPNPAEVCG